jgi:(E)-4-hydroxy-3-methylbut-2-enyl-diphosphate synthase
MNGSDYYNSISNFSGFKSRTINIGNVPLGGDNPIRIQSMTSVNTLDTEATVEQSIRMINAGCEYVRIATPTIREAKNLINIKNELKRRGYTAPLIADVHFKPEVAEYVAAIADKVRINPGNYADRKKSDSIGFTDTEYNAELDRIRERLKPLIDICKNHGTVIRVGSNHGSLSERIKIRYGDTPLGMVESALEFIRICEDLDFRDIVVSMKSSNTKTTVYATRLLINRMMTEGMNYPVHLGVTEAGEGEDGRIKSAAGIGSLLADGIGDTIRVSLTEDPEKEIPVAKTLLKHYSSLRTDHKKDIFTPWYDPFNYERRETEEVYEVGGSKSPVVITGSESLTFPYLTVKNKFIENSLRDPEKFRRNVLVLEANEKYDLQQFRNTFGFLEENRIKNPVILKINYQGLSKEEFIIHSAADIASIHIDGFGDGIWLTADETIPKDFIEQTAYNILQAVGTRISKTEYISCPSCSRTSYDIQSAVKRIREKTSHLKGLKIAVMGCIVNGPGEMADAHYGYIGSSKSKVNLYKGKKCVRRNVDECDAVNALIELIKAEGDWFEKEKGGCSEESAN